MTNDQIHLHAYKGLDSGFPKKEKVFVVRNDVPYFSEVLGVSLPNLLVNPALRVAYAVSTLQE